MTALWLIVSFVFAAAPLEVPPELSSWVPWVLATHPDHGCAWVVGKRTCAWPGVLTVNAAGTGGTFEGQVSADGPTTITLPGSSTLWPQDVTLDGKPAVLGTQAVPTLLLPAGTHTVRGRLPWNARPATLTVSASAWALVDLVVDGVVVQYPHFESDELALGAVELRERAGETVSIDVSRHVTDGIPLAIETRIDLRVSGRAREVDLGVVSPPNTHPVGLSAGVPVRLTVDGHLVAQVRPGSFSITLLSVTDGSADSLAAPSPGGDWPATEYWVVRTDEPVRAVNLGGVPGVDPARTTIPAEWRNLPTFALQAGQALSFETLRRGAPPSPDALLLQRELWLDLDGEGFTVRDQFTGQLGSSWRLDAAAPLAVGHVAVSGMDRLVTLGADGAAGVELRDTNLDVRADGRIDRGSGSLPAVGWRADVTSLQATLHTGPGWTLIAAQGVDRAPGALVDQWNLLDLFYVLLMGLGTGRMLGVGWGVLAGVGLAIARHEDGAPQWLWVLLLATAALGHALTIGRAAVVQRGLKALSALVLLLVLIPFSIEQVQGGLYPALKETHRSSWGLGGLADMSTPGSSEDWSARGEPSGGADSRAKGDEKVSNRYLSSQVDPAAVVQTGPGIPNWAWQTWSLEWSGPVAQAQDMRLWLLGPWGNLALAAARVGLLLALAIRLARHAPQAAAAVMVALLCFTTPALAAPDAAVLAELERRLTTAPACGEACVVVPAVKASIDGDILRVELEAHAAVDSGLPLPGPASTWVPRRVWVDGANSVAIRRDGDNLTVRIPAGVHHVVLEGAVPPTDAFTVQFPLAPRRLDFRSEGWTIDGVKADGTVDRSIQFARLLGAGTSDAENTAENLSPWLVVERRLDLGIPWRVETVVLQKGASNRPVSVRVPLLPGESVTDATVEVVDGTARVALDRDRTSVAWTSTLAESPTLVLTAPATGWTEQWTVSCSPVYRCGQGDGPSPIRHVDDNRWWPMWRPLPGEAVTLTVSRPAALDGQTTTIDASRLSWTPGRRSLDGTLDLEIRSSQGGRQVLALPAGAVLRETTVAGEVKAIQLRDDGTLHVPLNPGAQAVRVTWTQPVGSGVVFRPPDVPLGGSAVNGTVIVNAPSERWIVFVRGPPWGPVVLFWKWLLVVGVAAPLLRRLPGSPLSTLEWALLGLGTTQIPLPATFVIVGWLVALGLKEREPENVWVHNLLQGALTAGTLAALCCLYAAIHAGLLWAPDMQVSGNSSNDAMLQWTVDRVVSSLPSPTVLWLPLWVWRVLNLLWALWLASRLVSWLPRVWRAFALGGFVRWPQLAPLSIEAPERSG